MAMASRSALEPSRLLQNRASDIPLDWGRSAGPAFLPLSVKSSFRSVSRRSLVITAAVESMPGLAPTVLLNDGKTRLPLIGLGTAAGKIPDEVTENGVITAIEAGYRHFDTAALYGSERAMGKALKKAFEQGLVSREEVFVASKLWCADNHPDDVLPAVQKSLGELQLDYLDLYLIHWPVRLKKGVGFPDIKPDDFLPVDVKSTWKAMEKLLDLGLVRAIGVSNFSTKKLEDLLGHATIRPAVDQVETHPIWQQTKLREFCNKANVHITAWAPLGAMGKPWGSGDVRENPVLVEIAKKHGKTPPQVALRWGIEQGISLVPKSYNRERLLQNISIFDWKLDEDDLERIKGIEQRRIFSGIQYVNPINGSPINGSLEELWDGEL